MIQKKRPDLQKYANMVSYELFIKINYAVVRYREQEVLRFCQDEKIVYTDMYSLSNLLQHFQHEKLKSFQEIFLSFNKS